MAVITPAYPSMNSTYNVSVSTLDLMKSEFIRGVKVCSEIDKGEKKWDDLFVKTDFFQRYKVYVQTDIISPTEESHRLW